MEETVSKDQESSTSEVQRRQRRTGARVFVSALLVLVGVLVCANVGRLIVGHMGLATDSIMALVVKEGCSVMGAVLGVIVLGGRRLLTTSGQDMCLTFRLGWWYLAASCIYAVLSALACLVGGASVVEGWLQLVAIGAVGCLLIGIYEELLFRGIVFQGLLALMGGSHRTTLWAVAITSVLFGLAHVDVSTIGAQGPVTVAQAILKVIQTGMVSVLLCTCVLCIRRLGAVSLLHALSDFVLVAVRLIFMGDSLVAEYVLAGEDALAALIFYVVTIVLYLPFTIASLRELHRGQHAWSGAFFDHAVDAASNAALRAPTG